MHPAFVYCPSVWPEHCDRVTVVAPDRDRSGASNSLTLDQPIRVEQQKDNVYKVFGTPTDCVHVAITGLLDGEPDMVVSGINAGANMGDDVLYSGTVAAAMEGRFLGLPAMAVSLSYGRNGPSHYESAARAATILMRRLVAEPLPADTILNVNVPDLPWAEIRGFETTRLGHRHRSENVIPLEDPRGRTFFLDRTARRRAGQRPRNRFQCSAQWLCLGDTDSCRSDPLPGAGSDQPVDRGAECRRGQRFRMIADLQQRGIGMTSENTRQRLVRRLREKGIANERVLDAIAATPRHLFVDEALSSRAYEDTALPIGRGQTISQPYVVALMTAAAIGEGKPDKVLEIGTGSGYQAAILAALSGRVFTTERNR